MTSTPRPPSRPACASSTSAPAQVATSHSAELRAEGLKRYPQLQDRPDAGALPDLGQPFGSGFDGVLCAAVLMHLPREQIFDAAFALCGVVKDGAHLLLSVPLERPGIGAGGRDEKGCLSTALQEDSLPCCT